MMPEGYRELSRVDFVHNRAQLRTVTVLSIVLMLGTLTVMLPFHSIRDAFSRPQSFIFLLAYIPYIFLHEFTHGLFIRLFSGRPAKYGLSLQYAYAGSDFWFTRRQHRVIALAPIIVWGAVFGLLSLYLPRSYFWAIWFLQAGNISGSAGDLYCAFGFLRYPASILIQDSGTDMTIAVPSSETRI